MDIQQGLVRTRCRTFARN